MPGWLLLWLARKLFFTFPRLQPVLMQGAFSKELSLLEVVEVGKFKSVSIILEPPGGLGGFKNIFLPWWPVGGFSATRLTSPRIDICLADFLWIF